jgi:PPP family 3-phenylpropionic acid transporter
MNRSSFAIVWLLRGYYFFYFAMVGVYIVFLPKILTDLGYSPAEVGIIYAAAPMMRFLLPFVFQHIIELNYKIFAISLFATLIAVIMFWFSIHNFWSYLAVNILFGAAMGISLPYIETIALGILDKTKYGKVRLWGSIGFMLIVIWLGRILDTAEQGLLYLFATALLTLLLGIMVGKSDNKQSYDTEDTSSFSIIAHAPLWLSILLMQISFGGFYSFFTIYETAHGISLEMSSWLWGFGVICEIAMLYFQGPLLKRNLLNIIKFATLVTVFRWLLLYIFPDSIGTAFLSQSMHAISFALYHTAMISYIYSLYTQKRLAQQFFLGIGFGLGGSLGAYLAGIFYGHNLFLLESIIALLAFAVLFLPHKKEMKNASQI